MAGVRFMSHLNAADSLLDLARRLGVACLERELELAEMREEPRTSEEIERLEKWTGRVSAATWEEVIAHPAQFERRFGAKVTRALRRSGTRYPLDCLAVLRGLCRRPLGEFFAVTRDQVGLDRGLPVRFAKRPLPEALGDACTSAQETLNNATLLHPLPYDIFGPPPGGPVRVVLDHSYRERLDELTWDGDRALPKIATLHPRGGGDLSITRDGDRFFDVRPRQWDEETIVGLLRKAKAAGANLAVLPELSLPTPDALEARIKDEHESLPPIIVAGSAHLTEEIKGAASIRANESRIYLDGQFVAVARKHKAFVTNDLDGKSLREDLTLGQTTVMVLSGRKTRLAVAICADLQEKLIPSSLVAAGVNLLLAPAMTKKIGSFNGPVCDIASYCQGVAAVANTRWEEDGKPFLALCAVPREDPKEQSAALPDDGMEPAPVLGVLNPNLPLPEAVTWA